MRISQAFTALALALITGIAVGQQHTIRVSLEDMTAEVVSVQENAEGTAYTTVFPDGTVKDGLWDSVTLDDGIIRGIRVLSAPVPNEEGVLTVDTAQIAIRSRGVGFDDGLSRHVPDVFLADLAEEPLEVSWVTDTEHRYTIGTHPADDDASTVPVFTRTSDGEIRRDLWEENATDKPVTRLFVNGPFFAKVLDDGTIEFIVGRMGRHRRSGTFPPGYLKHNTVFDVFPVEGLEGGEPNAGKSERGPCFFNLNLNANNVTVSDHPSLRSDAFLLIFARTLDAVSLYSYYFSRSCADITMDIEFDNTKKGGIASADVTFFYSFLPDVRVALREQADFFMDDEPIDFDMYSTIPFQFPDHQVDYFNQNNEFHRTEYIAVPESLSEQVPRYEKLATHYLAMIKLAMIQRCLRILDPSNRA